MATSLRNIVVVGGSFAGAATSQGLANLLPSTHRVLLIEPHSHFHYLFAFPRFSIVPTYEHKAFIPFSGVFAAVPSPERHHVVRARVSALHKDRVVLDREWQGVHEIPYDYLVLATGTNLRAPGTMKDEEKALSVKYLQNYQQRLKNSSSVAVIGGGAVGVQKISRAKKLPSKPKLEPGSLTRFRDAHKLCLKRQQLTPGIVVATDLKEIYPEKEITLIHSRDQLMPLFHNDLSEIIKARCQELGVKLALGSRVNIPEDEFQNDSKGPITLSLQNGNTLHADAVILATGQMPNTQFFSTLPASSEDSLLNPTNGFIRVRPTLQLQDPSYPHLFAVGDVADSGAHKAARPGVNQAQVVAKNILDLVEGREPSEKIEITPPGIHLSLGLSKNIIFRNPNTSKGDTEPSVVWRDDGTRDMEIDAAWVRRGVPVKSEAEYHL
ncbi:hypothetical protein GQX73_g6958 [Xylaria multiplex]|uniref:FAD/NAD(P)-binding domain-containing protein n=1 Tax=Xylaria multiplex TaxID=323545 RepID=A0A7C8ILE8_9PEZI|nr:hypothetical protein GQX73_g6958 [Xylaria multiplex]